MNTIPYLSMRNQRFYFRRTVPKNLRGFFGQREVIRSLTTSDPREAQRAAIALALIAVKAISFTSFRCCSGERPPKGSWQGIRVVRWLVALLPSAIPSKLAQPGVSKWVELDGQMEVVVLV